MKSTCVGILFSILILSLFSISTSHAESADSMGVTFDDLAWLVGHWQGDGFGGICEEIWHPATAGSMAGIFKHSINGKTTFYEIMTITIADGKPQIRLKHFNPDLTGWEGKNDVVEFPFVSASENALELEGLAYHLVDKNSLMIEVRTKGTDEQTGKQFISCKRVTE